MSATCDPRHSTPYAWLDLATASLRTFQASLLVDILSESYATLPKAGIACDGVVYRQPSWELPIKEDEFGLLPTPTAQDALNRTVFTPIETSNGTIRHRNKAGGQSRASLSAIVNSWATPQAGDYRTGSRKRWENPERSRNLNDQVGGQLNPTWVEWLMGWPVGWTDLKPLAMDKYRLWLEQHGIY